MTIFANYSSSKNLHITTPPFSSAHLKIYISPPPSGLVHPYTRRALGGSLSVKKTGGGSEHQRLQASPYPGLTIMVIIVRHTPGLSIIVRTLCRTYPGRFNARLKGLFHENLGVYCFISI